MLGCQLEGISRALLTEHTDMEPWVKAVCQEDATAAMLATWYLKKNPSPAGNFLASCMPVLYG